MRDVIRNLRNETETTLRVFYALRQFRYFVSKAEAVEKINQNANFWLLFETSLRTNLFLGIRRLYEAKRDTFNFQTFINSCLENIDEFAPSALRERKCAGRANAHEWIEKYMQDVYEPSAQDFRALARLVRENSRKMKGPYIDAATKIYAHAIHLDRASMAEISDQLNFEEIEQALLSIWHVYEQIWQLYENGCRPNLEVTSYPYVQEVVDSVSEQVGWNEA